MRTALAFGLLAMLCPPVALAQTNAAPSPAAPSSAAAPSSPSAPAAAAPARTRGSDITRDEYVQRAVDRARRAAEKRFDQMDTDHDGVLTADERRAYRATRRQQRDSQ